MEKLDLIMHVLNNVLNMLFLKQNNLVLHKYVNAHDNKFISVNNFTARLDCCWHTFTYISKTF